MPNVWLMAYPQRGWPRQVQWIIYMHYIPRLRLSRIPTLDLDTPPQESKDSPGEHKSNTLRWHMLIKNPNPWSGYSSTKIKGFLWGTEVQCQYIKMAHTAYYINNTQTLGMQLLNMCTAFATLVHDKMGSEDRKSAWVIFWRFIIIYIPLVVPS